MRMQTAGNENTINLLGYPVLNADRNNILQVLEEKITGGRRTAVCHVNAHILVLAEKSKEFSDLLKKFDVILPDGAGVYLASKFLYGKSGLRQRITGTDLYPDILKTASGRKKSFLFIGADENMHAKLADSLKKNCPDLKIAGAFSREESFDENFSDKITGTASDVIFVGTGSPYQEEYIMKCRDSFSSCLCMAIGSGLEYYCGYRRRAPAIMRSLGLEWLYRLFQEPARLWKRYILGIPLFIFYVVRFKFKFTENA